MSYKNKVVIINPNAVKRHLWNKGNGIRQGRIKVYDFFKDPWWFSMLFNGVLLRNFHNIKWVLQWDMEGQSGSK
jgi:hypothetical protein